MKLSALSTKLTCMKSTAVRVLAAATLAGAVLAAAPAAQAQRIGIGVQFGGPVYAAPAYGYAPGYYGDRRGWEERREAEVRREQYIRHEQWEHAQRSNEYRGQRYGRDEGREGHGYGR
jgi:hypothetical protein